jgi:hypothetical protein
MKQGSKFVSNLFFINIICFVLCFSLFSCQTTWAIFDLLWGSEPPLRKRIQLDKSGVLVNESFSVKKYCSYGLKLRLLHKKGEMHEYKKLSNKLPEIIVNIFRLEGENKIKIYHNQRFPRVYGYGMETTSYKIGGLRMDKGEYFIEIESLSDQPLLAGIEVDLVIGRTPKTNCPKK